MTIAALVLATASLTLGPGGWWERLGPTFDEGVALYQKGSYAEAASRFSRAIPASPHPCFYNRALCHYRLGKWKLARADFDNALQTATAPLERSRSLVALAAALLEDGQPEKAIGWLKKARKVDGRNPFVHANLAAAYEASGQNESADEAQGRLREIRDEARRQKDTAILQQINRILAEKGGTPAFIDLSPVEGDPGIAPEPRAWASYAGRWELLVLMVVVWTILLVYLRISSKRRQRALKFGTTTGSRSV